MPHVAYKCPDPAMWSMDPDTNEMIDIVRLEDCLDCSLTRLGRGCHFDFQQLMARREDQYTASLSPSRFNGCDRELYFKEQYDFWTDPNEAGHKVRGTAVHSKLETSDPRVVSECRVYRVLPGAVDHEGKPAVVSVQPDIVYPSLRQISDTKTWRYLNVKNGQPLPQPIKTENRFQLSVGAWAWRDPIRAEYRNGDVVERPEPIEIESGQVMLSDGKTLLRQSDIELIPDAVLERWMRLRVLQINRARRGEEPPFPPVYKRWRCDKGCPVRYLCNIPQEMVNAKRDYDAAHDKRHGIERPEPRGRRVLHRGQPGQAADDGAGPPARGTRRRRDGTTEDKG